MVVFGIMWMEEYFDIFSWRDWPKTPPIRYVVSSLQFSIWIYVAEASVYNTIGTFLLMMELAIRSDFISEIVITRVEILLVILRFVAVIYIHHDLFITVLRPGVLLHPLLAPGYVYEGESPG